MRADGGGRALVIPCPQCATRWSTEQTLAAHLMDVHGMEAAASVRRAAQCAQEARDGRHAPWARKKQEEPHEPPEAEVPAKERPMSTKSGYTCSKCGTKGHSARSPECPQRSKRAAKREASPTCGYCHRLKTDHRANCPYGGGKKRKPVTRKGPAPKASGNGFAGALQTLRAERTELEAAIAALERLEARR